jgi:hypothetical protein
MEDATLNSNFAGSAHCCCSLQHRARG